MIVTTKKLFEHAYGKYAIGAYNVNNLEQIDGLFKGNLSSQSAFHHTNQQGRPCLHQQTLPGRLNSRRRRDLS